MKYSAALTISIDNLNSENFTYLGKYMTVTPKMVTANFPDLEEVVKEANLFFFFIKRKKFSALPKELIKYYLIELLIFAFVKSSYEEAVKRDAKNRGKKQTKKEKQHIISESFLKRHYGNGIRQVKNNPENKLLIEFSQQGCKTVSATTKFKGQYKSYSNELEELLSFLETGYSSIFETGLQISDLPFRSLPSYYRESFNKVEKNLTIFDKLSASLFMSSLNARASSPSALSNGIKQSEEEIRKNTISVLNSILYNAISLAEFNWTWLFSEDSMPFPFLSEPLTTVYLDDKPTKHFFPLSPRLLLVAYHPKEKSVLGKVISIDDQEIDFRQYTNDKVLSTRSYEEQGDYNVILTLVEQYADSCNYHIAQGKGLYWHPAADVFSCLPYGNRPCIKLASGKYLELTLLGRQVWSNTYYQLEAMFPTELYESNYEVVVPNNSVKDFYKEMRKKISLTKRIKFYLDESNKLAKQIFVYKKISIKMSYSTHVRKYNRISNIESK